MQLFYKEYGEGHPLLILHGLLGASGNWHTLSSRVFSKHFHVYTLDLRNHGRSPHSEAFDYAVMAEDLRAFMEAHGLAAVHLLGHSMGGKAAMQFALTYPEHVDRLIVVDIAPKAYPPHHAEILDALREVDLQALRTRQEVEAALAPRIKSAPVRQFLLKNLDYDSEAGRYRWQMNLDGIYRNYDRLNAGLEAEGTFAGPTLFIRGGSSDYVADEDTARIKNTFPDARIRTIPGAGHWVHAEAPQPFAQAVLDFLRDPLSADVP